MRSSDPTVATASPRKSPRLLVVGCGNLLAADDAVGVEVVERLIQVGESGCQLCVISTGGVDLLETFPAADLILFVDAVSSGAPPGTIHLVPLPAAEVEARAIGFLSSHGWGLIETLDLARALGRPIPRVMLLGVEVGLVAPGTKRSPAVARARELIVQRFSRLQSLLVDADSLLWRLPQLFPPDEIAFPDIKS